MTYDTLERVITKTYPNTLINKNENVTYTYDNLITTSCSFSTGYLCSRTDESATTCYNYDSFGNIIDMTFTERQGMMPIAQIANTVNTDDSNTESIIYLYTAHLMTNLHYNIMRYYDPSIGRYITNDPIGLDGGMNTYGYANQNSIMRLDILGLIDYAGWAGIADPYNTNNPWQHRPPSGPFGIICGPSTNPTMASWIPDIYQNACYTHDKCYDDCSKTKQQCDKTQEKCQDNC